MQKGLAVVTFLSLMLLGAASARAEEPQAKVEAALNELHQWVGEGATGEGWRKFLKSDALAAELAKGAEADPKVVGEVLAQYQSGKPGLEMSRFAAVREALAAWEAELLKPTAAELPKLVRDAAGSYQPVKPEAVTQAKAELTAAVSDLDRYLSRDPKGVAGWKKFLRWDELTPIVQAQEPPPTEAVAAAVDRFRANQKGLELPQFTRVRIALENYAAAAVAAANGGLQEQFAQRLEALAKQLETYSQDPAAGDEAIAIGRTLGWLERNHQSPELVTAVRMVYSQPNLYAYASKRLAAVGIEEEIDENQPVRDNILGTSIYGTARMKGHTKLELLDSPSAALFNVLLTGQASSNNVGYNSGVSIYTTGLTQISGIKQLKMDVNGMTAGAAAASCQTATSINNIGARGRMVERIAWNRATGAQGQAQAIASNHAEARVANQMNERSAKLVAEQNDRYFNKFKNPLVRRGHFPRDLNFSSRP
ncbi:MAG TPA: hypothetical protein VFV87_09285, partial [Pirellulaceae bacterium]|nr:hypothetical protein [Pirellulaceae bacterium]